MSVLRMPVMVLLLLLATAAGGRGETAAVSGFIVVEDGWVRATPLGASIGGGFLTIGNESGRDDRLVGISSPRAQKVELHETVLTDDLARMRPVPDGMEVPDGARIALAPGAYHLMFIGLSEPFREGATVPISLTFEKAGRLETELAVLPLGSPGLADQQSRGE